MTDWKSRTLLILNSLDLKASKTQGQNFLIKQSIINNIINYSNITSHDSIIEIGGGIGILTEALLETGAQVTVIEKEPKLAHYLSETYEKANVINADALNIDWPEHSKLVSNLPYSISSQILAKIMHQQAHSAYLMLQKEVADRCNANPGDRNYSRISVLCKLHADVRVLFNVGPQSFFPRPKVTSSVVEFITKPKFTTNNHADIEDLVLNIFTLRRRTLRSVLKSFLKRKKISGKIWDGAPFAEKRVYCLQIDELDQLTTYLKTNNCWPFSTSD